MADRLYNQFLVKLLCWLHPPFFVKVSFDFFAVNAIHLNCDTSKLLELSIKQILVKVEILV